MEISTDNGSEIADDDNVSRTATTTNPGEDALLVVIALDPLEPCGLMVEIMQRQQSAIEPIEILDRAPDSLVERNSLQEVPVEADQVVPLLTLGKFTSHEEQFLSRVGEHKGVVATEIGKFLPRVSGHLVQEGTFAMDNFIVRQRQDKIFVETIEHAESQVVMMMCPVDGLFVHVFQGIVHPTHVPLEPKTESARTDRPGDLRPGGGFFGDGDGTFALFVDFGVEGTDKIDGFDIFLAAILVGDPLAILPGVVVVEHGRDGIDPEGVEVELFNPVEGVGDQVVTDLLAAKVVDQGIPIGMEAAPGIGMFVECCAIELSQAMAIGRKVADDPIHDNADSRLVQAVDEVAQIIGLTIAACWREKSGGLITPGTFEGKLGKWQKFDVGEPQVFDVGNQFIGNFAVGETAVALLGFASPRTQMEFVDAHGGVIIIVGFSCGHPLTIVPLVLAWRLDDGSVTGGQFGGKGKRVGLVGLEVTVGTFDLEFVDVTGVNVGDKEFPQTALLPQAHGVPTTIPVVKIADNADSLGVGSPNGKGGTFDAIDIFRVCPEMVVEPPMATFGKKIHVHFAKQGRQPVGIFHGHGTGTEIHRKTVFEFFSGMAEMQGVESPVVDQLHPAKIFFSVTVDQLDVQGTGQKGANDDGAIFEGVHPQECKRVSAVSVDNLIDKMVRVYDAT